MANKIIRVGKEYEKAFMSICALFKSGFVSSNVIKEVSEDNKRIIVEDNSEYVYSPEFKTIESDTKIEINDTGATWFKSIREKTDVDFGSSSWLSLIEKVSTDFHKANSFLEFEQSESVLTGSAETFHRRVLKNLMSKFFPQVTYSVRRGGESDAIDDIYGISLLIELDGGTGESQKVLCKVFFRKIGHKFNILSKEDSKEIEEQIYAVINQNNDIKEKAIEDSSIIESILAELEKVIDKELFTQSAILNSERDQKIIDHFLETGPQGYVEINCRSVKVFGIYHVKWHNFPYEVYSEEEPILKVIFDLKGRMTVRCMRCFDTANPLVSENVAVYRGKEKVYPVRLNLEKDDFGLEPEIFNRLVRYGDLGRHIIIKMHDGFARVKTGCRKIVCRDDLIVVNGESFCRDCPYPEIAFKSEDGSIYPTSTLAFARDKLTLINKDEVKRCKCCGRTFSIPYIKHNKCKLCNSIESISPDSEDNVFKKYGDFFPITRRILTKSRGVAVEDEDIILFMFGEKKYIFDKTQIQNRGFVENPQPVEE